MKHKDIRNALVGSLFIVTSGFLICSVMIFRSRRSELLLPWYDVASTGDGVGPEVVNYWQVTRLHSFSLLTL
jgi:hypothetical protein